MGYDNQQQTENTERQYPRPQNNNWGNQSNHNESMQDNSNRGDHNAPAQEYPRQNNYQNNQNSGYPRNNGYQGQQNQGYPKQNNYQNGYQKQNNRGFQRREEPEGPVEFYKPYVGTGNRDLPPNIAEAFKSIAQELERCGYTLRSGGMLGSEDIFEKATTRNEIHLPWKGFNDKDSKFTFTTNAAKELASKFHPAWDGLKPFMQTFLAKNVRMIMGKDLKSPALFMIVWSEDGAESIVEKSARTGDIGHAICVAHELRIPVFNFAKPDAIERLKNYLKLTDVQEQTKPSPQPSEHQF